MAATVERLKGRHVSSWSAAGGSRRGRSLSTMAAPETADAAGSHVSVGCVGPRHAGLRYLDEAGHAIHRYLVSSVRLEDHAAHHPSSLDRQRRKLIVPHALVRAASRLDACSEDI